MFHTPAPFVDACHIYASRAHVLSIDRIESLVRHGLKLPGSAWPNRPPASLDGADRTPRPKRNALRQVKPAGARGLEKTQ
jgi:hypothetical protein